ncbi:MAG TPA: glycosyltransferase family 2 protein [Pseudoduganella sp.]
MRQASTISLIITTYNRPDALTAVVEACFAQDDRNFEIIIADDGSTNNTRETIAALQARSPVPMKHVWQEDIGFRAARARNLGTLAAQGEYIIFIDGDCVPQKDFIANHRRLAKRGYVVTGSRVLLSEAYTRRLLDQHLDIQRLGALEKLKLYLTGNANKCLQTMLTLPDLGRESKRFTWRRIKSCNMAAWRSDLDLVNGFDESFTGWGHEDSDLVLRLFNAGVLRKSGAFATEVYHLWHREAKRDQESSNRKVVLQRAQDKTTQAVAGLRELRASAT